MRWNTPALLGISSLWLLAVAAIPNALHSSPIELLSACAVLGSLPRSMRPSQKLSTCVSVTLSHCSCRRRWFIEVMWIGACILARGIGHDRYHGCAYGNLSGRNGVVSALTGLCQPSGSRCAHQERCCLILSPSRPISPLTRWLALHHWFPS